MFATAPGLPVCLYFLCVRRLGEEVPPAEDPGRQLGRLKPGSVEETDDDERVNAALREQQALAEEKLAEQAADYEDRLTELHSVIAELTRRMEIQRAHTIREEVEEDEEEEEDDDDEDEEDPGKTSEAKEKEDTNSSSDFSESDMLAMIVKPMDGARILSNGSIEEQDNVVTQVLKRELRLLQEENERLRTKDRDRETEIAQLTSKLDSLALSLPSSQSSSGSKPKSKERHGNGSFGHTNKDHRLEIEKLVAKLNSAKATNDLLTLQLKESRLTAENMFIALTKEESNCVALQMAMENSRRTVKSYEALLGLMDAELSVLFVNCRLAGISVGTPSVSGHGSPAIGKDGLPKPLPDKEEASRMLNRAYDRRNFADAFARQLVVELDAAATETGSKRKSVDEDVDCRLRAHAELWKAETEKVAKTVQSQRDSADPNNRAARRRLNKPRSFDHEESPDLDFEAAVLVQELYAVKEEKADLESRYFICNKERQALELQCNASEAREAALKSLAEALRAQLHMFNDHKAGADPNDEPGKMKLALRVHELGIAVETLIQDSDIREKEARLFLADLKKANQALAAAVDQSRSRNQMKSRRLEQEIAVIVDRHAEEVRSLNLKIGELQNQALVQQARLQELYHRRYPSTTSSSSSSQRSLASPPGYADRRKSSGKQHKGKCSETRL
ncbi:unnamed protein product [Notodromas monacha]|uniref:Harmonin-binding protein USHBP1 PDZ-binding domain-containing protein n=1 Tax=Notodromas monacha TaxID=399045 RepID=A0A7R9BG62_9CRUS|nr:unnamed protein product [Notodromas monacha]CAG0914019.1 unnamed protein product [Notodromas monacha]